MLIRNYNTFLGLYTVLGKSKISESLNLSFHRFLGAVDISFSNHVYASQLERQTKTSLASDIEILSSNNATVTQFWNTIKYLGPRKSRNIPVEVIIETGESDISKDIVH